jgi:hypothetical protein
LCFGCFARLPRGLLVRSSCRTDRPLTGDPCDALATSSALGVRLRSPFPFGFPLGPFRRCSRLVVLRRPLGALLSMRVVRLGGWIAFPRDPTGAGPARRSLVRGARRARPPPLVPHGTASAFPVLFRHGGLATLQGAQRVALGLPGTRGARPGGDPGPFDRCLLLTDSVLKELSGMLPKSRYTPQRKFPRAGGAPGSRPSEPASANRLAVRSVVFSVDRRAGVPLMPRRPAGTPGGAVSTGVGPQSCAFGAATSGRPEGLGRFHQAA